MNFYPLLRTTASVAFFVVSLVILFNPELLAAISPYAVEGRHLLIGFTGTLLYLSDSYISLLLDGNATPCLCTCR